MIFIIIILYLFFINTNYFIKFIKNKPLNNSKLLGFKIKGQLWAASNLIPETPRFAHSLISVTIKSHVAFFLKFNSTLSFLLKINKITKK